MDKSKFTTHPQLDSEGFVLSDERCVECNPEGWREVDGVLLPPITWAELPPR